MPLVTLFMLAQFLLQVCTVPKNNHTSGVAHIKMILYNIEPGERLEVNYNIWFKDSVTIQEVPIWNTVENTAGNRTHSVSILHYTYINPEENIYRDYRNFSDTSAVKKAYKKIDEVSKGGGWNFYINFPYTYDTISKLNDSVVDNVNYSRFKLSKRVNNVNMITILFTRCEMKNFLIKQFKAISDSIGCPILRAETYQEKEMQYSFSVEVIKGELSQKELQIFETWRKRGKKK